MMTFIVPEDVGCWTFDRYLNEVVWSLAGWRSSAESANAALQLYKALNGKPAGAKVSVGNRPYELLMANVGLVSVPQVNTPVALLAWTAIVALASATSDGAAV
jgi:hypothetical protein